MSMKTTCLIAAIAMTSALGAHAAGLTVATATIASGKLTVKGSAVAANATITLDGKFTVKSSATKTYVFSRSDYHPGDCIVTVTEGSNTAKGVVANCGQSGIAADLTGPINATALAHTCGQLNLTITGAKKGDVPLLATTETMPSGVTISMTGTPSNDLVKAQICNETSQNKTLTNFQVRVITFR